MTTWTLPAPSGPLFLTVTVITADGRHLMVVALEATFTDKSTINSSPGSRALVTALLVISGSAAAQANDVVPSRGRNRALAAIDGPGDITDIYTGGKGIGKSQVNSGGRINIINEEGQGSGITEAYSIKRKAFAENGLCRWVRR